MRGRDVKVKHVSIKMVRTKSRLHGEAREKPEMVYSSAAEEERRL